MTFEIPKMPPARVFINYAHADIELAKKVADGLMDSGASVWIDTENIRGGDLWKNKMDDGLWRSQFVIAIVTKASLQPDREWVQYEQRHADLLLKVIIPCVFDEDEHFFQNYTLPEFMHPKSAIVFGDWKDGFQSLKNTIQSKLTRYGETFANHAEGIQTPFVGRQADLKKLNDYINGMILKPTGKQTIAISAAGGMGKTMLAQELVRRLAFHFFGGTIKVDRGSNKTQAKVILANWARKLKPPIDREYTQDEIMVLVKDIRSGLTEFGALLVLIDDVGDDDLEEVRILLNALPVDATTIITTRMSKIPGTFKYSLSSMSKEDSMLLLSSRLRDNFLTEVDPDGTGVLEQMIKEQENYLLELITLVDGHPLALDLGIGICMAVTDIPFVVDRLKKTFLHGIDDFIDQTALSVSDKNTSLAASLGLSLRDLKELDEANGTKLVDQFSMLGVFPDGATMSQELLMGVWEIEDEWKAHKLSNILVSRAMLRFNATTKRFYNHPVIRAFASGLLSKRDDSEKIWNRYANCILDRTKNLLDESKDKWKNMDALIEHIEHIGKRLRKKLEDGGINLRNMGQPLSGPIPFDIRVDKITLRLCLDFAHALKEYVIRNPEWGEQGIRCLLAGLITARVQKLEKDEIAFLKRLGGALTKSDPKTASSYFSEALKLANKYNEKDEMSAILSYYGELERTLGNFDFALDLLREALDLHRTRHDLKMEAATLKYMGEVYWRMSDYTAAFQHYEKAKAIYESLNDVSGEADLLNKVGSVYFNKGEHQTAIEKFDQAEEMHRLIGNSSMRAEDINDMGASYRYLGKSELALDCFNRALKIHEDLSNLRLESLTRSNRAGVLCDLGRYKEALEEAQLAVDTALHVGDVIAFIWSYCWLGAANEGLGLYDDAGINYQKSLQACRRTINPRGLAGVLGRYANLLNKAGRKNKEAINMVHEALALMKEHDLKQVFGGWTQEQMYKLKRELEE
jgi:tetratricopeptide (TPR) repeat protein